MQMSDRKYMKITLGAPAPRDDIAVWIDPSVFKMARNIYDRGNGNCAVMYAGIVNLILFGYNAIAMGERVAVTIGGVPKQYLPKPTTLGEAKALADDIYDAIQAAITCVAKDTFPTPVATTPPAVVVSAAAVTAASC